MDEETVHLILTLQMEDLDVMKSNSKGKAAEGSAIPDSQLAIELQKAEIQKQKTLLEDLRMANSISRAVQDDGTTVTILMAEERRCVQDREAACRMSGQHHDVASLPDSRVDEDLLSRLGSLNIRQADDEDDGDGLSCYGESIISTSNQDTGESSAWAARRKPAKPVYECVACLDVRDTVQVPCQHQYCKPCILNLVNESLIDESLFPPRCCRQEMPTSLLRPYMTAELTAKFEQKGIEMGTPNRTYCYSCGVFINPDAIHGHHAHCEICNLDTCMLCGGRVHQGDCPKDLALERVLQIAQETGWQRCQQCQNMIERREGCNHIT